MDWIRVVKFKRTEESEWEIGLGIDYEVIIDEDYEIVPEVFSINNDLRMFDVHIGSIFHKTKEVKMKWT